MTEGLGAPNGSTRPIEPLSLTKTTSGQEVKGPALSQTAREGRATLTSERILKGWASPQVAAWGELCSDHLERSLTSTVVNGLFELSGSRIGYGRIVVDSFFELSRRGIAHREIACA